MGFLIATSYGNSTETSGRVQIPLEPKDDITDRYVILVEDDIDTDLTLSRLTSLLSKKRPSDASHRMSLKQAYTETRSHRNRLHRIYYQR